MFSSVLKKDSPLSPYEDAKLSTFSNWCALFLFRPLDTYPAVFAKGSKKSIISLWSGWPTQILNKTFDDEVFGYSLRATTKVSENVLGIKNPSSTLFGKTMVGIASRWLTVGVTMPWFAISNPRARKVAVYNGRIPLSKLYSGVEIALAKESVFTAAFLYVLNSCACLDKYKTNLRAHVEKYPAIAKSPKAVDYFSNTPIGALKSAIAGGSASLAASPFDFFLSRAPVSARLEAIARRAFRKMSYNGVSSVIGTTLKSYKVHRNVWDSLFPNYYRKAE